MRIDANFPCAVMWPTNISRVAVRSLSHLCRTFFQGKRLEKQSRIAIFFAEVVPLLTPAHLWHLWRLQLHVLYIHCSQKRLESFIPSKHTKQVHGTERRHKNQQEKQIWWVGGLDFDGLDSHRIWLSRQPKKRLKKDE